MVIPGRKYLAGNAYRYGFNGQEKDNEVKGDGNCYTAEFWEYDSRIGRRWNIDPVLKVDESSYLCFSGNPIWLSDTNGDDTNDNPKKKHKPKTVAKPQSKTATNKNKTVTDAGHGDKYISKKTGKRGKYIDSGAASEDQKELEKDYALMVESAINDRLIALGIDNTRTRTGDVLDAGYRITWRVNIANAANASVLVSIHLNDAANDDIKVYYEPGITNETNSIKLGNEIIAKTSTLAGLPTSPTVFSSRLTGVGTLGLLRGFKGDAGVLIEVGGIKSEKTRNYIKLNANEVGAKIADGMFKFMYGKEPGGTSSSTPSTTPYLAPVPATSPKTNFWDFFFPFKKG